MSKEFAALLAQRFAPLEFSSVPGFPHPVPDISKWGDFLPTFKEDEEDNLQNTSSSFTNAWIYYISSMKTFV